MGLFSGDVWGKGAARGGCDIAAARLRDVLAGRDQAARNGVALLARDVRP